MKYVDASAVLRILFCEPGPAVPLTAGGRVVSSQLVEIEAFRAVDRERLLGNLDDVQTAAKRKELGDLLVMLDLAPIDGTVIHRAKGSFAVNVRALDTIHVAKRRREGAAVLSSDACAHATDRGQYWMLVAISRRGTYGFASSRDS